MIDFAPGETIERHGRDWWFFGYLAEADMYVFVLNGYTQFDGERLQIPGLMLAQESSA